MRKFDLYIANPIQLQIDKEDFPFNPELLKTRGYIQMGKGLKEARNILKRVRSCRGNAYLVPVEYRTTNTSIRQGRKIAMGRYKEIARSGRKLGALDDGYDDILWWTYCADDTEAIEKGLVPGRIAISVDKLDGHIRSKKEFDEWVKLSIVQD